MGSARQLQSRAGHAQNGRRDEPCLWGRRIQRTSPDNTETTAEHGNLAE